MGLIKFLVIALGISYLFMSLLRFFFRTKVRQMYERAQQQQAQQYQQRPTGSIKVDHVPNQQKGRKKFDDREGEYVPYEEVK